MNKRKLINFGGLSAFYVRASYVELYRDAPENVNDSHVHPECEIYVNLSGDVSFMVENRMYGIMPYDIVITRPYEYHHCIYNSDKLHRHFWILFSPGENKALFPKFFNRTAGEGNLLAVTEEKREELASLCKKMSECELSKSEKYACFFRLISLIEGASPPSRPERASRDGLSDVLNYISENFRSDVSISDLSEKYGFSLNTLERRFRETLGMSPSEYLKKKRLAAAAELLFHGKSVSEACEESGFSDYSHFIAVFRKSYGMTPLQYKKSISRK